MSESRSLRTATLTVAALLTVGSMVSGASGQVADTAAAGADQEVAAQDSAVADTTPPPVFPLFPAAASVSAGLAAEWNLPDLLATGALSFADLFEFGPHLDPLRAGFLEGPHFGVFAGAGAGSFGYDVEGYRVAPLLGGGLDLNLPSLVELQRVRLIRVPGGYRAIGELYRNERREPYSRIEAGTGDENANLLRGTLSSRIGRTPVGFGYDRFDTDGAGNGSSRRDVVWASAARRLAFQVWGQLEFRGTSTDRDSFPNPQRTDWILRLRRPFERSGWSTELIAGHGVLKEDTLDASGEEVTGRKADASQFALRVGKEGEGWSGSALVRRWVGDGVPEFDGEASLQLRGGPATLYASGDLSLWEDFDAAAIYGAVELELPLGLRARLEAEDGARPLYTGLPIARFFFTRVSGGLEARLWSWRLGGLAGRWRTDPSPGVGRPFDDEGSLRGGTVDVLEGWARGPLLRLFGGRIEGGGRYRYHEQGPFLYWPQISWQIDGLYYVLALEDQLEIWLTGLAGVRGEMLTFAEDEPGEISALPDLRFWRSELVVRIKSVYIFFNYEYFDSAPLAPADVSGFPLPITRTHFGVKWEFWN